MAKVTHQVTVNDEQGHHLEGEYEDINKALDAISLLLHATDTELTIKDRHNGNLNQLPWWARGAICGVKINIHIGRA